MNPPRPPHADDDPAPGQPSTTEESDTAFGTRMQAADSEAERFGNPDAAPESEPERFGDPAASGTTPPDPTPGGGGAAGDGHAADALRSYADSQPQPPTTEPLTDPLGEVGHPYS